jgi:AraC-like DNA-binding protein
MAGSPGTEVAAVFGMAADTFYDRVRKKFNINFTQYSTEKKATGEAMIRKQQLHKALGLTKEGDNTLLIWLGKQRLGQKETLEDSNIHPEANAKLNEVLQQLSSLQSSARKIDDNSAIKDHKS